MFCLDKYDQLKKYVLTFFNTSNDDQLLSYGQQQMLNIQETFFKSKSLSDIFYWNYRIILDCEPIDLTDYESRQQQIVQSAVEKWLKT